MRTTWCWGKWLRLAPQRAKGCFLKGGSRCGGGGSGGGLTRVCFVGEILTQGFCQCRIWGAVLFCWCSIRGNYFGRSMCFRFWRWRWLLSGLQRGTRHNSGVVGSAPTCASQPARTYQKPVSGWPGAVDFFFFFLLLANWNPKKKWPKL